VSVPLFVSPLTVRLQQKILFERSGPSGEGRDWATVNTVLYQGRELSADDLVQELHVVLERLTASKSERGRLDVWVTFTSAPVFSFLPNRLIILHSKGC